MQRKCHNCKTFWHQYAGEMTAYISLLQQQELVEEGAARDAVLEQIEATIATIDGLRAAIARHEAIIHERQSPLLEQFSVQARRPHPLRGAFGFS